MDSCACGPALESASSQFFYHATVMLLLYIIQTITAPKLFNFRKSVNIQRSVALLQVTLE